jgi:acetaldehyde dehydrogenase/alcohol dehydrogenase
MCCCSQDIRKRINAIPDLGKLAKFVAIPTTSGTGSEVTPFAVVTDEKTGIKYPLADYALVSCCCWFERFMPLFL